MLSDKQEREIRSGLEDAEAHGASLVVLQACDVEALLAERDELIEALAAERRGPQLARAILQSKGAANAD
jgi:hypothetical protein